MSSQHQALSHIWLKISLGRILLLFKRLSVSQLLLLAFLVAGLLPAMLVSALSFYQARTVLKKEISRDMQTLSETVANDVARMMFERVQNVASWSRLAIMQELQIDDVDKRLSTFLQELHTSYGGVYRSIYVLNNQNKVVASSDAQQLNKIYATRPIWFSGETNQPIAFYKIENNVLAISQAIHMTNENQVIGQLVVELNWQQVQDLLNSAVRKPSAAALFSEDGHVIAATSNWNTTTGHEMRAISQLNRQSVVPKWQVRVEKLRSVAIAPLTRLGYIFLALLATTLLLAAFLVRPIAHAITRPLANLSAFVRSFKQEHLSEVPKTGPPEVQELGIAFEGLMQDLAKTQANLTRAAKLAVVGEMAAAMSHEVRTPLGILRSSADLLLREPALTKDGKEVLGFIISETVRLNKLVSTLIDSARPRAAVFIEVDITQLVRNTVALLSTQAESKKIEIGIEYTKALILAVDVDQMTQVLMNLIMNAIQILPIGGKVNVHLYQKQHRVYIEIADNGSGISIENQTQIFEPFFTQRAGGVGLGLAIVRQIVQAHHGEITCSTSQLGGAQFTIQLPMNLKANKPTHANS